MPSPHFNAATFLTLPSVLPAVRTASEMPVPPSKHHPGREKGKKSYL
jgi:hypothetical protein